MQMHQQIPEGQTFVEPRGREIARGLLDAAEALGYESSVVTTQSDGFLAPSDVVERWQSVGDVPDDVEVTQQVGDEPEDEDDTPAKNASKAEWVEFATAQGYDESEGLTKDQLIERYGASE